MNKKITCLFMVQWPHSQFLLVSAMVLWAIIVWCHGDKAVEMAVEHGVFLWALLWHWIAPYLLAGNHTRTEGHRTQHCGHQSVSATKLESIAPRSGKGWQAVHLQQRRQGEEFYWSMWMSYCPCPFSGPVFKLSSHLSPGTHSQVSSIIDKPLDLAGGLVAMDLD